MSEMKINVLWKFLQSVISGRVTIDSAVALIIPVLIYLIAIDSINQTPSMFVLLLLACLFYLSLYKMKSPKLLQVSDLKEKIVDLVSNFELISQRSNHYNDAILKIGQHNKGLIGEIDALKRVLKVLTDKSENDKTTLDESIPSTNDLSGVQKPSERFGRFKP